MVMDTIQIRLNHSLTQHVDNIVKEGMYSSRSDVIRDAVRRFVWESQVNSIKLKGSSIKQVKKARKELSKDISLKEINSF